MLSHKDRSPLGNLAAMVKRECTIKASPCYRNRTKVHVLSDSDT